MSAPISISELIRQRRTQGKPAASVDEIASMPPVNGGGTAYGLAALNKEAMRVATSSVGARNDTLNRAAFSLGQLVAGGQLDAYTVQEALTNAALACGLPVREIQATLRSGGLAGARNPRSVREAKPCPVTILPVSSDINTSPVKLAPQPRPTPLPVGESKPVGVQDKPVSNAGASTGSIPDTGVGVAPPGEVQAAYEAWRQSQVDTQAEQMRIHAKARQIVATETYLETWQEPQYLPTLTDELAIPDEAAQWRIEGLLPADANALLTAQYKTGKTTLILNLIRALADRTPFLDTQPVTPPQGRIAYFNYEVTQTQIRRWFREQNIANTREVSLLNLRGLSLPLTQPVVKEWVVNYLIKNNISVWIIDPYARAFIGSGDNENDNMQAAEFLDTIDQVKHLAGVKELILATHTGRSSDMFTKQRARGATRIDDWADERWILTRNNTSYSPDENEAGGLVNNDSDRFLSADGRDVNWAQHLLKFDPVSKRLTASEQTRRQSRAAQIEDVLVRIVAENPGIATRPLQELIRKELGSISREIFEGALADARNHLRVSLHPGSRGAKTWVANQL